MKDNQLSFTDKAIQDFGESLNLIFGIFFVNWLCENTY
jgi:hypothetical protein